LSFLVAGRRPAPHDDDFKILNEYLLSLECIEVPEILSMVPYVLDVLPKSLSGLDKREKSRAASFGYAKASGTAFNDYKLSILVRRRHRTDLLSFEKICNYKLLNLDDPTEPVFTHTR
jgi:hypothetical protein